MYKPTLTKLYAFSIALRQTLLRTAFGWVSECKHSPTCGAYTMQKIQSDGLVVGLLKGCSRILRCW